MPLLKSGPLIALVATLTCCTSASSMDMADLLKRHTEARGGMAAIEAIRSLQVTLQIEEPTFSVRGEYVATRTGNMRIDIYAGEKRVFTEALGPDGGWQWHQGTATAEDLSEEGKQALRRGLIENIFGLHELADLGYELRSLGQVEMDDCAFWLVELEAPDGYVKSLYLGAETYLVEREIEQGALHPDLDSTKTRRMTMHDDFATTDGVVFPRTSRTVDLETGAAVQSTSIKRIRMNEPIRESLFGRPESPLISPR